MPMATHDKLPGIEVYLVEITPDVASEMLDLNTKGQRTISRDAVERYATDMVTMDWLFNGAAILISNTNELLDGQHRLSAIIESGESQVVLIVRGIDPKAMTTIDAGRKRSYADSLKIRGFANHTAVAAINARVWYWFHGNYGTRGVARVGDPKYLSSTPSNAQKDFWMDLVEKAYDITIPHAATFANRAYGLRRGISTGTYGLAWVILSGVDKDLREQFFHELLVESESSKSGYPIVALTNRLGRLRPREEFSPVDQLDALFTTYNFWVAGKELLTLNPPRPVRFDKLELPEGYKELEIPAA
jgi:hypothetical protein